MNNINKKGIKMINHIQNFKHLSYYPNTTIDDRVYKFIKNINLKKDVSIEYFLHRLNFYLSITNQTLDFFSFNNSKKIEVIFSDFYSFLFGLDNYFNDSDSNRIRYTLIFKYLEESLNINILNKNSFDYKKINYEKLEFFKGWFIKSKQKNVFINFINFYNVFGKDKCQYYYEKIKLFAHSKGVSTIGNNTTLIVYLLNFFSSKKNISLCHDDIIFIMKEYFGEHDKKGNNINDKKSVWNWFIELCHSVFNLISHEKYILSKSINNHRHVKIKSGKHYKTKLITEIPLEIYDNEAFDILFKKINDDVKLINEWAEYTIQYHYNNFINLKEDLSIKKEYYNKSSKDIAILKYNKYDGIKQSSLYDRNSYFNKNVLFAIVVKLVINHPEITDSFIMNCEYLDDKDNNIGIIETDQGVFLLGAKARKGINLAEQKILLNKDSMNYINILLEMTKGIRENLKENNNDLYKKLFISANVNNLKISSFSQSSFKENKEPFNNIIKYIQHNHNISYEDTIKYVKNISLTKLRASRGVQIYFDTKSTTQMSKALGHTKYDPQLLSHYLPASILDFFQRRWILLFQKGIICESLKDSGFLFKASNFKNMDQLNTFLENHALKNIPNTFNDDKDNLKKNNEAKVYISIDEEKIATLLSIGVAIDNSKDHNKISSKAIYWKKLGEEIVKEINDNKIYSQYKNLIEKAKNKINPDLFGKVIYE